jgi:hypothetical protein
LPAFITIEEFSDIEIESTELLLLNSKGHSMESKPEKQFIEPLLKLLRKFQNNTRCLYPGCQKRPIGSHLIAESVLEQLADEEGKVLTWEASDNDIVENTLQGYEWERVYKQPKRVGIRREVTYPIFCREHDNGIFTALEDNGFTFQKKQVQPLSVVDNSDFSPNGLTGVSTLHILA